MEVGGDGGGGGGGGAAFQPPSVLEEDYGNFKPPPIPGMQEFQVPLELMSQLRHELGIPEPDPAPAPEPPPPPDDRETWEWQEMPALAEARCFASAVLDPHGCAWCIGGGDSPLQYANVFRTTEVLDLRRSAQEWVAGPSLNVARCGHGSACLVHYGGHGTLFAVGGYGGGVVYHRTSETFDLAQGEWRPLAAEMGVPRVGAGVCAGPDGCLYAVGGSPDGSSAHITAERFDPRVGSWDRLPDMALGRAYTATSFAASGLLYAGGGMGQNGMELKTVECFDPRANKWRVLRSSQTAAIPRADLAMVYGLF